MSRWSLWGVAFLVAAVVVSGSQAQDKKDAAKKDAAKKDADKKPDDKKPDDKKPDDKKPTDKKPDDKKPMDTRKTTVLAGEIVHIEPAKQAFRVKVTVQYQELNQGEANALLQANRDLSTAKNRDEYAAALRRIADHRSRLYSIKSKSQDYAIDSAEDMKVRLNAPKSAFDDMGNVKKYTAKELQELRGKDKLFDGEFADLTNGQIVQVTILLPKVAPKPKNKDDIQLDDNKLEATKVVVLKQPIPK